MTIDIKRLNSRSAGFWQQLKDLQAWESESNDAVLQSVNAIIKDVRARGDTALIELTARFDDLQVESM
jgi:histidinol dehydrogenase